MAKHNNINICNIGCLSSSEQVCVTIIKVERNSDGTAVYFSAFVGDQSLSALTVATGVQV